jgi:hypothetical protein
MTIQLDNGTDIEITEQMISITNGFRGFTWDLDTNEVATATTTVLAPPHDSLRAILTKLMMGMDIMLGYIDECCLQGEGKEILGGLRGEDFKIKEITLCK